jgi:hypothetical protein
MFLSIRLILKETATDLVLGGVRIEGEEPSSRGGAPKSADRGDLDEFSQTHLPALTRVHPAVDFIPYGAMS